MGLPCQSLVTWSPTQGKLGRGLFILNDHALLENPSLRKKDGLDLGEQALVLTWWQFRDPALLGRVYCLRSPLRSRGPRYSIPPLSLHSCLCRGVSSRAWPAQQAGPAGLSVSPQAPEMEMASGTPILPFSTRLDKYFGKIMTGGRAVPGLRSHSDRVPGLLPLLSTGDGFFKQSYVAVSLQNPPFLFFSNVFINHCYKNKASRRKNMQYLETENSSICFLWDT